MTFLGWAQIALFCLIIVGLTRPLGGYMTRLFAGERTFLSPVLGPVERGFYRAAGIDERSEQHWVTYGLAMLAFNAPGLPAALRACSGCRASCRSTRKAWRRPARTSSFNTAVSFVTNTNWQSYGGESTLGYLVQMAGLTVQNFVSAATGIALSVALVRGFTRAGRPTIGNFWADLVRCTLYLLLPLSIVLALFFVWQGVPQNLDPYVAATTLEGGQQTIAQGPVASQLAIKMLGTNGGGFFNANSAHPYENPTPLSQLRADARDLRDRRRADQPVRPHGRRRAPGLGDPGRHGRAVPGRRGGRLLGRGPCQPGADRARRRRHGRQHGGQGGPLRHRRLGPVRRDHHRRLLRCRQRHARELHAAGRDDPADQHGAGRDHRRRRRRRPLRHAAVRDRRHVRGRA